MLGIVCGMHIINWLAAPATARATATADRNANVTKTNDDLSMCTDSVGESNLNLQLQMVHLFHSPFASISSCIYYSLYLYIPLSVSILCPVSLPSVASFVQQAN